MTEEEYPLLFVSGVHLGLDLMEIKAVCVCIKNQSPKVKIKKEGKIVNFSSTQSFLSLNC